MATISIPKNVPSDPKNEHWTKYPHQVNEVVEVVEASDQSPFWDAPKDG